MSSEECVPASLTGSEALILLPVSPGTEEQRPHEHHTIVT